MINFYTTEAVKINCKIPANMRRKNADEICRYVMVKGSKCKAYQMLEATSDTVFDPQNWKNPIYAKFANDADGFDAKEWVKAAIIFYHGVKPVESFIGVYSHGYAC